MVLVPDRSDRNDSVVDVDIVEDPILFETDAPCCDRVRAKWLSVRGHPQGFVRELFLRSSDDDPLLRLAEP